MSYIPTLELETVSGVSGTSTGATKVMTTKNNGKLFHPITIYLEILTGNTVTGGGSISCGTNGASYDNIVPIQNCSTLTSVAKSRSLGAQDLPTIAANTDIYVNLTTAFTAVAASLRYTILGYYL